MIPLASVVHLAASTSRVSTSWMLLAGAIGSSTGLAGCQGSPVPRELPRGAETFSLLGEPLFPPVLDPETEADRLEKLAEAEAAFQKNPYDLEAIVWYGRRHAYLGHYRRAVEIYTRGLEVHPQSPELFRHRGHRYITLRRLDAAISDLQRATRLIAGTEDVVEPDGLPNARNTPTSTLHSNIWYHLGLAYYLRGDLENARQAYEECLKVSKNPDMLCATSHWLYMTLQRRGSTGRAEELLTPIHESMDVIENHAYHDLLLFYKGEREEETLLEETDDGIQNATLAYGVANWHYYHGRLQRAQELFEKILEGSQWAAFGYIAAEAELWRKGGGR